MRLGNIVITKQRRLKASVQAQVHASIASPAFREQVLRIARGEVKNYLAEIAEEAGMPFVSPAKFMESISEMLSEGIWERLNRNDADKENDGV